MEALSEAQVAAVSGHLAAVLGQDNQLRKQHEVELNNLRE